MFKTLIFGGKKEKQVITKIREHINVLCQSCQIFKQALQKQDLSQMEQVSDLERRGDVIRREIVSSIYEGAFLPFVRPNICKFVEIVDDAIDEVKRAANTYCLGINLTKNVLNSCCDIAELNLNLCEMFSITFDALCQKEDLREKLLVIRIYEKKIDELSLDLLKEIIRTPVTNFWQGKILSDFISSLSRISDVIENASDYLQILDVSLR